MQQSQSGVLLWMRTFVSSADPRLRVQICGVQPATGTVWCSDLDGVQQLELFEFDSNSAIRFWRELGSHLLKSTMWSCAMVFKAPQLHIWLPSWPCLEIGQTIMLFDGGPLL